MGDRNTPWKDGRILPLLMAGGAVCDAGCMVGANGAGFAVPAADSPNLVVLGMADEQQDNSDGGDGDRQVLVRRRCLVALENSSAHPVGQAQLGRVVYVEDAVTVSADPGTNAVAAGVCLAVDADGVWVEPGALVN